MKWTLGKICLWTLLASLLALAGPATGAALASDDNQGREIKALEEQYRVEKKAMQERHKAEMNALEERYELRKNEVKRTYKEKHEGSRDDGRPDRSDDRSVSGKGRDGDADKGKKGR
ncbi:hypothetical protein [Geoalkalibacter sp.]|jgi:hypothetical protein|uniref:hypothetical protein n=1 Tax=Geoalkalibacter sp. TaxID=3041440 RepID=UPI00272E51AF|nr:hypothetical protein [Geoalkalibacter sp.]